MRGSKYKVKKMIKPGRGIYTFEWFQEIKVGTILTEDSKKQIIYDNFIICDVGSKIEKEYLEPIL